MDAFDQWLVSDTYIAKGGEEYITIGNFKNDREMKILSRTQEEGAKEDNRWSYVYVDNVKVTPVKERTECSCENDIIASLVVDPPLQLSEYEKISLEAVYFEFDKSDLTKETIEKLDEVYTLLRRNRAMYIEIDGHTDIIGSEGYNIELSKKRAQMVIDYLVNKGIDASRLTIKFFGSSTPATENETTEGRAKNRRVEFQVLQKKYELVQ
ncbi:MAG: OmpA family protein [Flavobacteriales bacterium]